MHNINVDFYVNLVFFLFSVLLVLAVIALVLINRARAFKTVLAKQLTLLGVGFFFMLCVVKLVLRKLFSFSWEGFTEETLCYGVLLTSGLVVCIGLLIQFDKITGWGVVHLVGWAIVASVLSAWAGTVWLVILSDTTTVPTLLQWGGLTVRKVYWSVDQLIKVGNPLVAKAGLADGEVSVYDVAVKANNGYDQFSSLLNDEIIKIEQLKAVNTAKNVEVVAEKKEWLNDSYAWLSEKAAVVGSVLNNLFNQIILSDQKNSTFIGLGDEDVSQLCEGLSHQKEKVVEGEDTGHLTIIELTEAEVKALPKNVNTVKPTSVWEPMRIDVLTEDEFEILISKGIKVVRSTSVEEPDEGFFVGTDFDSTVEVVDLTEAEAADFPEKAEVVYPTLFEEPLERPLKDPFEESTEVIQTVPYWKCLEVVPPFPIGEIDDNVEGVFSYGVRLSPGDPAVDTEAVFPEDLVGGGPIISDLPTGRQSLRQWLEEYRLTYMFRPRPVSPDPALFKIEEQRAMLTGLDEKSEVVYATSIEEPNEGGGARDGSKVSENPVVPGAPVVLDELFPEQTRFEQILYMIAGDGGSRYAPDDDDTDYIAMVESEGGNYTGDEEIGLIPAHRPYPQYEAWADRKEKIKAVRKQKARDFWIEEQNKQNALSAQEPKPKPEPEKPSEFSQDDLD